MFDGLEDKRVIARFEEAVNMLINDMEAYDKAR